MVPDRPPAALAETAKSLSHSQMRAPGPVWVDDRNPIYRRGLVACLRAEGYAVAGESVALRPAPNRATTSLLILDVDAAGFDSALALARRSDMSVIGLVRETPAEQIRELLAAGMFTALPLRSLTPLRLLSSIQALAKHAGSPAASRREPAGNPAAAGADEGADRHLTGRELDVLRLLAEGGSTRDIAQRLSYSERTVKNIVHDVLGKLNGRTRAHAVAVASRRGII
jgi:DNA-binding NarL/FixJ family response regulator